MEVLSLADARASNDPLRSEIGRLIEVVGTPKFEAEFFKAARSAINCEHMTAFAIENDAAPRVVLAANTGTQPIARSIAQKYIAQYWKLDPSNEAMRGGDKNANIAVRVFPEEDIDDRTYRYECFTAVHMMERVSVMQRRGPDVVRVNFLTGGRYGRFADADIDNIMNSADLLISLVRKHDAAGLPSGEVLTPQLFQKRLRLVAPSMPAREMEVCTAIMLGMTSEAIALKLGISVNTVLTYRKRAYGRLNISCQNELMRLILS